MLTPVPLSLWNRTHNLIREQNFRSRDPHSTIKKLGIFFAPRCIQGAQRQPAGRRKRAGSAWGRLEAFKAARRRGCLL